MGFNRLINLAMAGLLAVACGSVHGVAISPTTASSARDQCPAARPAPQFQPSAPSNRNLAIVQLQGHSSNHVIRDITDISHPATVSEFAPGSEVYEASGIPQFASGDEISFGDPRGILRAPLSGTPATVAAQGCLGVFSYTWNPDGTALAYVTSDNSDSYLHIVRGGQDRIVSSMPPDPLFHEPACWRCLLYSPSGAYISSVEWPGRPLRIWSSDGKVLKSLDSGSNSMSVWSGNSFYWMDGRGIEMWRAGVQSLLLPGLSWIGPMASPAGGQIVYATRDGSGTAHDQVLDISSGKVREIAKSRAAPAFLNPHLIWYMEQRPCESGETYPCGGTVRAIATGKTFVYDLQVGSETQSKITVVFDVWPHAA